MKVPLGTPGEPLNKEKLSESGFLSVDVFKIKSQPLSFGW